MRLLLIVLLLLTSTAAIAHESRPFYIELTQQTEQRYQLLSKVPPSVPGDNQPRLLMPEQCTLVAGKDLYQQWYQCALPLDGEMLSIQYPLHNPSVSTMIRFRRLHGELQTVLLSPHEKQWTVPPAESISGVAGQYTVLGMQHILAGYDHLLFLACLIFIAGTLRRMVITLTGFTIAHSLTLVLAALGWLSLSVPAVEAVIALSIVFLARELLRPRRDTLTWRYPIAVASSFGLLHGLGFAAVLGEIGLPQTQVIAALVFFNLGVELGQLLFIFVIIGLYKSASRLHGYLASQGPIAVGSMEITILYSIGGLSTLWLFERIMVVFL